MAFAGDYGQSSWAHAPEASATDRLQEFSQAARGLSTFAEHPRGGGSRSTLLQSGPLSSYSDRLITPSGPGKGRPTQGRRKTVRSRPALSPTEQFKRNALSRRSCVTLELSDSQGPTTRSRTSMVAELLKPVEQKLIVPAEVLKQQFNAVDARIDELIHRHEDDERRMRRVATPPGTPPPEEHTEKAAQKATRDPQRNLERKLAERRESQETRSVAPSKAIPMLEMQVERQHGNETVAMVDVLALRCRSKFGTAGGQRQSVKQLIDLQRHQDRQRQLAQAGRSSLSTSMSAPALSSGPSRQSLSWEERLGMVKERKRLHDTEKGFCARARS